jgi:predicted aspartyl protease
MTIVDSVNGGHDSDEIVVTARSKFGQLILVDASANGMKVNVVIDTGSQVSIGNPALRAKLEKRGQLGVVTPISILSVTGGRTPADYTSIAHVRLGTISVDTMPVAFADAEIFHRLGLSQKPAILLGMDVLRGFDRVSVDYANRSVRFILPGEAWGPPPRLASADRRSAG